MQIDYKGYCLWADDIPSVEAPHYIVVTSSADPDGYVLIVALSSIKYKTDGTPKYYDSACEIHVGDILNDQGESLIKKPSYVRYEYAVAISQKKLFEKQITQRYKYRCKISDELLLKIQKGARMTKELQPRFKKFFDFF